MKIVLIRHGEQEYPYDEQRRKIVSSPDAPLVELGRMQMRELGKKLTAEDITLDIVYTSPLPRAQQSAEILAEGRSVPIYIVDELKEIFPNSAEGRAYEELEGRGGDIYANPFSADQESLGHLVERERAAVEFILSDAREKGYNSVAIVGHGDPLCALDWSLKHTDNPTSYAEMRDSYYPQKAQALEYILDSNLELEGERRIITTEAATQTIEGFRNPSQKETE